MRRTPAECDVAHVVNCDIVLCELPLIDQEVIFGDRECFAETRGSNYPLHQFHLSASEEQIQQLEDIVGQRITLHGRSSVVCWEHPELGVGGLYCRSTVLDMTGFADEAEHQLSDELADEFSTHCHVVFGPTWKPAPSKAQIAGEDVAPASSTKWKMLAVTSFGLRVAEQSLK